MPQPQSQLQLSAAETRAASEADDPGEELPELTHPRSHWLRSSLRDPEEDFKAIARVGDISHGVSADDEYAGQTHVHASLARLCKTHIELDRNEGMREVRPCSKLSDGGIAGSRLCITTDDEAAGQTHSPA